jgi:hypothetical protein
MAYPRPLTRIRENVEVVRQVLARGRPDRIQLVGRSSILGPTPANPWAEVRTNVANLVRGLVH